MSYQQDLAKAAKERRLRLWPASRLQGSGDLACKQPVVLNPPLFYAMSGTATGRLMDIGSLKYETPVPVIPIKVIIAAVAEAHDVREDEILGTSRVPSIMAARFHAIWLTRRLNQKRSLPMIGRAFNRDHSTICNAVKKWEGRRDNHKPQIAAVNAILFPDAEPMTG